MKNQIFLFLIIFVVGCQMAPESHPSNTDLHYSAKDINTEGNWANENLVDIEEEIEIAPPRTHQPPSPPGINVRTPAIPREVIKTADYKLQVEDLDNSTNTIHKLAEQYDAYVSGMDLNSSARMVNNVMTLRVPNANFESLLKAISAEAIFTNHKKIHAQDVTEQYVDIQSRLKVKKEIKAKYEKMLRDDAKSLTQIFNAEEKIRVLQEEIEAKEGKLRYLSHKIDLSEIKLEIYQQVEYQDKLFVQNKSFFQKSKDGFLNGWSSVQTVLLSMLNIWPILFLGGFVWNGRDRIRGFLGEFRRRNKNEE